MAHLRIEPRLDARDLERRRRTQAAALDRRMPGAVGVGEVRPDARQPRPCRRPGPWPPPRRGPASRGRRAGSAEAAVNLEVDAGRAARWRPRRVDGLVERPARVDAEVDIGPATAVQSSAGPSSQARAGASMPAARSSRASSAVATPSQVAPPSNAARATWHHAVAVAVRLDHRHHRGITRPLLERRDVGADGIEIDARWTRSPDQCLTEGEGGSAVLGVASWDRRASGR